MIFKRTTLLFAIVFMIFGGVISFFIIKSFNLFKSTTSGIDNITSFNKTKEENINIVRLGGFNYIKPILYAEEKNESIRYSTLKSGINNLIDKFKNEGCLNSASVYLRDFKYGDWMDLYPEESFQPGSLLKVPILISFLKMNELKPGVLNNIIVYDNVSNKLPNQNIASKSIKIGQKYTIKELLHYMIANSDNNATCTERTV